MSQSKTATRNGRPVNPATVPVIFTPADRPALEAAFAALLPVAQAHRDQTGARPTDRLTEVGIEQHYGQGFSIDLRIKYKS